MDSIQNFYFYSNKNSLFDYLGRRMIAVTSVLPERTGIRTISTKYNNSFFITHRKLTKECRERGIGLHEGVYPVTLQLSFTTQMAENYPAVLIKRNDEGISIQLASLKDYDNSECIGALVFAELPFSVVTSVLFESADDIDSFYRPSDDYWYPTELYQIINQDDFKDEWVDFKVEPTQVDDVGISDADVADAIRVALQRENYRAALVSICNSTRTCITTKNRITIDKYLQNILGLSDEEIIRYIAEYETVKEEMYDEPLCLVGKPGEEQPSVDQIVYDRIFNALLNEPTTSFHTPEFFIALCDEMLSECQLPVLEEIKKFIAGGSTKTPTEVLGMVPDELSSIAAFFLIAKNPNEYEDFAKLMQVISVDFITARRAWAFWGALNGLRYTPGEDTYKDNVVLWEYVEAYCHNLAQSKLLPNFVLQPLREKNGICGGLEFICERTVTIEDVYSLLSRDSSWLSDTIAKEILKKFAILKASAYVTKVSMNAKEVQITIPAGKVDDRTIKELDALLKNLKKKTEIVDKEKLYHDIMSEKVFQKLFRANEQFWKNLFLKLNRRK